MSKYEDWETKPWERRDHPLWDEDLKTPGWPECGDGTIDVESLYQAFKERLMHELVATDRSVDDQFFRKFALEDVPKD